MIVLSRRAFLVGGAALSTGATIPCSAQAEVLRYRPPELRDPVTLDLDKLPLETALPGWSQADNGFDYKRPMSSTTAIPADRDVLVKGPTTGWRTGRNYLIGGRRVHVMGGAYRRAFQCRLVAESITFEGMVISIPEDTPLTDQQDLFDGTFLTESWPEVETMVSVLNCRGLNGRGSQKETHGDLFQLSGSTSSVPRRVRFDKFTGTTTFQGFMLSPQVFGKNARVDGPIPIGIWLSRVNLKALNQMTLEQSNPPVVSKKTVALLIFNDAGESGPPYGWRVFDRYLTDVFVEPANGSRNILEVLSRGGFVPDPETGAKIPRTPRTIDGGRAARYHPALRIQGEVQLGPPTGGDFARDPGPVGVGGFDMPGMNYVSPGYAAS